MEKKNNSDESDFSENEIPDLNSLKPFEFGPKTNIGDINSDDEEECVVAQSCSVKKVFLKFRKTKVFSCEFREIFKNTFNHRAPPVAASEKLKAETVVRTCSVEKVFLEILLNLQKSTCARVSLLQA